MANESLFPAAAIEALRKTRWDPQSTLHYEAMSGGLFWSDEFSREATYACIDAENYAYRYLIAYRASLINGEPREEIRAVWDQMLQECPDWPGFRPERSSMDLKEQLEARGAAFERGM